ncbi:MAG: oligosaccharide flippase family protein [Crocinitomicaceae bacterium]|nr:oligosaccharide flippase family protein [Crocinitomicaceae bacterium]
MLQKIKNKLNGDIHLKDLLKGSAITFVLKMGGMGLSYVLIYLISKQAGAAGVGFFQVMLQILTVLGMVLGLGMNISVLRYVGQFNNEEQRPKMHLLYKYFVQTVAPLTIAVGALLYFGADYIVQWTGKEQEYADGLKLVGIVLPFFTINQISVEFIRGLKKLQISELVRSVLRPLVMILGIVLFFYDSLTNIDIIYLLIIGLMINSIVSRWAIWKALRKVPKKSVSFERKELMKTSYPMMVTGISSGLMSSMPIFFLDYYTSQAEVGIYSVAFRLASLVSLILVVVNTIAAPKFAELYWAGKMNELQKVITQSAKMMFWVALSSTVILVGGGKAILAFFGNEFQTGYWVLLFLSIGQLINALTGSVSILFNMSGNQNILRKINIISFLMGVFLFFVISYYFKLTMEAAAIIFSLQYLLLNLTLTVIARVKLNLKTYFLFDFYS